MNFTPYTATETTTGRRVQVVGQSHDGSVLVIGYAGETDTKNVPASTIQTNEDSLFEEAVKARQATVRQARYGNSPAWRRVSRKSMELTALLAETTGVSKAEAAQRVATECNRRTRVDTSQSRL